MSEFLLRFRTPLSAAHTLVLLLVVLLLSDVLLPQRKPRPTILAPIELSFIQAEIPPSSEQSPATPSPSLRTPSTRAVAKAVEIPVSSAQFRGSEVAAPPVEAQPSAIPSVSVSPPSPVQAAQPPASLPPPTPPTSGREAEAAYVGKVRAYLQSIKRYPTGREASLQRPTGMAVIWFTVRRSGELLEAGIEASSGSMLLDNAALATVRRGAYPVFPDDAWAGKAQQRFVVELDFVPIN